MSEPMTDSELDEIERRCNAATDGPWKAINTDHRRPARYKSVQIGKDDRYTTLALHKVDAVFISKSRTDVPRLIAEVRRLRQALEKIMTSHRSEQ